MERREHEKIELYQYQKEAVKLAISVPYHLIAVQTGKGKSIISVFYLRILFKKNLADKVILIGTKTSVNSFIKAFSKVGVTIPQYDNEEDALNFFFNDEKICIWKHSMIKKIGYNESYLAQIRKELEDNYKRIAVVLDEGHELSNDESNLHMGFMNLRFAFERISVQTATPVGSLLTQLYGCIHLIYPKLWKSKRAFCNDHVEEKILYDYRTRRVKRKEIVAYKNLNMLRSKIAPFTYFYYPPLDLHFIEHKTRLKDYDKYLDLCRGVIPKEELEKK